MTRMLQLSDPHIVPAGALAYGVVDTAAALEATVATVNRLLPAIGPIDLAVVTGDLTDFGTRPEYDRFRRIMADLPVPYRAVPGNHDHRETMRAAFADAAWMPSHGPICWRADLATHSVLALDTVVERKSHGALSAAVLAWLEAQLEALTPRPVLVACHHPPVLTGIRPMDAQNLRVATALRALLDRYGGPCHLTCGHVHRSITTSFGTTPVTVCPGTAHAVTLDLRADNPNSLTEEPGGFMLHEYRDGFLSHTLPVGAYAGPFPFAPAD